MTEISFRSETFCMATGKYVPAFTINTDDKKLIDVIEQYLVHEINEAVKSNDYEKVQEIASTLLDLKKAIINMKNVDAVEIVEEVSQEKKQPKKGKKGNDNPNVDVPKIKSLYTAGWSMKKIADEVGCSERTVNYYLIKEGVKQ